DRVAMHRLPRQRLENQHVDRALQQIERPGRHGLSTHNVCGMMGLCNARVKKRFEVRGYRFEVEWNPSNLEPRTSNLVLPRAALLLLAATLAAIRPATGQDT